MKKVKTGKQAKYNERGKDRSRNNILHFMKRCSERMGFLPSLLDIEEIINQIQSGVAEKVYNNNTYVVNVRGKKAFVCIQRKSNKIQMKTIYPAEWYYEREKTRVNKNLSSQNLKILKKI